MGDVITKLEIITRKTKFQELKDALNEIGVMGGVRLRYSKR